MKQHYLLAVFLCFAATGCDRADNQPPASSDAKSLSTTPPAPPPPSDATLSGTYKTYCVYQLDADGHPNSARAAVIGLKSETVGGWETLKTVTMEPITHTGSCMSKAHFNTGDEFSVSTDAQRNFKVSLKLSGVSRGPFALSEGAKVKDHVLWYYTTTPTDDGYVYYVYMADLPSSSSTKIQRYRIEAFLVGTTTSSGTVIPGDTPACLAERPVYASNVFPVPSKTQCQGSGSQENSIGAGNEPR